MRDPAVRGIFNHVPFPPGGGLERETLTQSLRRAEAIIAQLCEQGA